MNQITVRGFDDELSACLRRLAKREGLSLNQAALEEFETVDETAWR